jgi:hypothetical protein
VPTFYEETLEHSRGNIEDAFLCVAVDEMVVSMSWQTLWLAN